MTENPSALESITSLAAWRQIVDSAEETAIICLDTEGLVRMWSLGAERILGWTESEMLGQPLDRIFTEQDVKGHRVATEMTDARTKGKGGGEEGWRVCKDGHRIWAVGEMSPIRDSEGRHIGFVKILRDRTAQMESESAILEERWALEVLNRAGTALARETDLQRLVQVVTDAGVELTGAQFGAFFYNVVDDAGDRYTLYTLSGASREDFAGFPMPRNTAVFAPTFNGEGIVRADDITKDPRYGHNAPRKGMPEGHLPVRSYLAVPVISRTNEVLGGLFFGHAEVGVFTERSERALVGLAAEAAVAIDNAKLAQQNQRELNERRRVEAELRELNATLEAKVEQRTQEVHRHAEAVRQLQKMEAVGQLTGGVAHDFNNLLQVIVGNLEIIRRAAGADNTRIFRAVEVALDSAKAGAAMTQRLLAFARRQPLDPKPLDVNVLVNGMSELMHRALGETIEIEVVLGAGLWRIEADANELERAILNLAVNARDAMPEGGKLTVETANCHVDEAYAKLNPDSSPGQYVAISVTDTGTGMDAETMRQAFEPFFTTKPVGRGTGLGLSQVYGFVKQSGGHVKLYSELNVGTTVRMYLPRLHGAAAEALRAPISEAAESGKQELVLVVEDDEKVRHLSVEMLRELGYQVLEAADGPQALQILEARDDIALLFTDVVLPGGMTGAQVAARARAKHPTLQVLFTTGYARNAIVHHGRLDAGVQLLTKPFTFSDLAAKVRAILDRR
jgi:PAS domain S-box-containing protein